MTPTRGPLPALGPAIALIGGATLSTAPGLPAMPLAWLAAVTVTILLAGPRRGLALVALFALGAWRDSSDATERLRRLHTVMPPHVDALECEVTGRVVASVEPGLGDTHTLRMRGSPAGGPALSLRLTVRAASARPGAELGALRRGDRVRVWCRLRRPRALGNPGFADPDVGLRAKGIDAVGRVKSARLVELLEPGRPGLRRGLDRLRAASRGRLDAAFGTEGRRRAFLGAVLLGDREALPDGLLRRLRDCGLAHLVAISGLHVGIVFAVVVSILARLDPRRRWIAVPAVLLLAAFALGVGARPSVLRAATMAGLCLIGRGIGRDGNALNTLAVVAAGSVALHPAIVRDVGFQLSFAATAGILTLSRPLRARLPGPRPVAAAVAVSLAAYAGVAPLAAWHFGRLAPVGVAANLPGVPLCGTVLLSGYATLALGDAPVLAAAAAGLCRAGVETLFAVADVAGAVAPAPLRPARPGLVVVGIYYGLLAAGVMRSNRLLVAALLLVGVWIHLGPPPPRGPSRIEARVLDVGQAQTVLVRGAGGVVLVDAAGGAGSRFDPGERVVVPLLKLWRVSRLEALVLSHEDLDHAGGAFAVLDAIEVGELWVGPGWHRSERMRRLAAHAARRGAAVVMVGAGRRGQVAGLPYVVLAPPRTVAGGAPNERSIVIRLGERPTRVLIPGDIEANVEARLASAAGDLRAEALLVPHHGSRGATTSAFLESVRPRFGVVSCGRLNPFGHPHAEVTRRLRAARARVFRTDRDGLVVLRGSARGWKVSSWRLGQPCIGPQDVGNATAGTPRTGSLPSPRR